MKKLLAITAILFLANRIRATEAVYNLSDAIQKKLVSVKLHGATPDTSGQYLSSHVGACMAIEIYSVSAEALQLNLDYGYRLVPDDSSVQTMMVTQTLIVRLAPKQKKKYRIYAMCTQANHGAPSDVLNYRIGKRFSGNLLSLAELIDRKKYQSNAAQTAVWCLTDNYDLSSIWDADTAQTFALRRFIAKVKGLPLASIYKYTLDESTPSQPVMTIRTTYTGSLSYNIVGSAKVMIALYDEDNHMKIVYVNNEMQREGQYTYNYRVTSDEINNKKHYLRMFRNGKLDEEVAIIPRGQN